MLQAIRTRRALEDLSNEVVRELAVAPSRAVPLEDDGAQTAARAEGWASILTR